MLSRTVLLILIVSRKIMKHSSGNGYVSLQQSITFPWLIWCPKLGILLENLTGFWQKRHSVDHKGASYSVKDCSNHPYSFNEDYETLK